jgi:hypothetical protein
LVASPDDTRDDNSNDDRKKMGALLGAFLLFSHRKQFNINTRM